MTPHLGTTVSLRKLNDDIDYMEHRLSTRPVVFSKFRASPRRVRSSIARIIEFLSGEWMFGVLLWHPPYWLSR